MSHDCERCLQWIKDDLVGELDADGHKHMETHLGECPACAREKVILERTLARLGELRDEPLPRHFFVYEDHRSVKSLGRRFERVVWGRRAAFAAVAAILVIGFVLVLEQTTLQWEQGRLTLSFGTASQYPASPANISPGFKDAVRFVVQEENQRWMEEIRQDLAGSLARASDQDRRALQDLVVGLELRLDQKLEARDARTRDLFQTTLKQWGQALAAQRQEDLTQIRRTLMQFAANDQIQAGQAGAIMAALSQIADVRDARGGSR
jgi:hypothetical protein